MEQLLVPVLEGRGRAGWGWRAGRAGCGMPVPDVAIAALTTLRMPIAYFMGGTRDILYAAAVADIDAYQAAPLFWASTDLPGDAHAGSFRDRRQDV